MEKLKAAMDFSLRKENINVKKDTILFVEDIEETKVDEKGNITLPLERAEAVKAATYDNKPLVEVLKEKKVEIETADLDTTNIETADIKPKRKKAVK